jgi:hypothetical protein
VTFYVQGHGEGDVRVGILNAAQEELEYHQHHQHEGGNFATFTFPIRKHEIAKFEYNKGAQDHRALFVAL